MIVMPGGRWDFRTDPPAREQRLKSDKSFKYLSNRHLITRCLSYFARFKGRIALAVVSMLVVSGSTGFQAWVVQPALDDIFIKKDGQALVFVPLLFLAIMTLKGVFRYLQNYIMNYCGLKVLERLRFEVYSKIVRLPMGFFEGTQVGMLMSRILNDVLQIKESLPAFIMLTREAFTILILIGLVFYRNAALAMWAVLVLPLAFFPFVFISRKLRKLGRLAQSKVADLSVFLQESFSGIRVVKAFANEKPEIARFQKENSRLTDIGVRQNLFSELSSRIMEQVGVFGVALVMWYGGLQVVEGRATPGEFFSFMAALAMLYEPIKKMDSSNSTIQMAFASAERVFEVLDSPDMVEEAGGALAFEQPFEELRLDDVHFAYAGSETNALDGVSLTVRRGQRVAIVGPSGSGKTTLVNLIPRFHDPSAGRILLNGRDLRDYTLGSLRMSLGMVSQEAFLFNLPVTQNIAYARADFAQEAVERAAQAAFAHDFVLALPEGYETLVGERGARISGGQRQRLTIARAIFKDPPLLILDEATSALDTESERIVQLALENLMKDRTSIVIAHRLSTVLNADMIVVMEAGRIVAQGSHAELLESCPLYARLYQMQFSDPSAEVMDEATL